MLLRRKQEMTALICGLLATVAAFAKAIPPVPDSVTDALTKRDAKDNGGAMAGVAVVDMTRLYNASGAVAEYERKVTEITDDAQRRIKAIAGVSQLTPVELQEFVTLAGRTAPTEAEQRRQKELQAISDQRNADYRVLQGKSGLDSGGYAKFAGFRGSGQILSGSSAAQHRRGISAGHCGPTGRIPRRSDEPDSRRRRTSCETEAHHSCIRQQCFNLL